MDVSLSCTCFRLYDSLEWSPDPPRHRTHNSSNSNNSNNMGTRLRSQHLVSLPLFGRERLFSFVAYSADLLALSAPHEHCSLWKRPDPSSGLYCCREHCVCHHESYCVVRGLCRQIDGYVSFHSCCTRRHSEKCSSASTGLCGVRPCLSVNREKRSQSIRLQRRHPCQSDGTRHSEIPPDEGLRCPRSRVVSAHFPFCPLSLSSRS